MCTHAWRQALFGPCASGSKRSATSGDPLPNATEYRQIVGVLQYFTLTHPKITFTIDQLCQHLHSPTTTHWMVGKCVLRYLKSTIDHGLTFSIGSLRLQAFSDSDWAGDPDDRRSTTSFEIF